MKQKWSRWILLLEVTMLLFLVLRGRLSHTSPAEDAPQTKDTLRIAGSSSMEKLVDALAERFMEKYSGVTVTVEFTGSSAGIEAVAEGSADIGNSSRSLKAAELERGLVENIAAIDGIALCVDLGNTVSGLTMSQAADIYIGAITNWSVLGGEDIPIVVVGREAGSGTRDAFEKLLGIEERCTYANELDSTGAVLARVASTPGAIGYLSFDAVKASVTAISLDGAEPTAVNVREGRYPLYRPFLMVTKGELAEEDSLVQAWFQYVYSEEGQSLAAELGLIRVR